ncbi:MAG: VapC toxin family PIN domain ribonuclease [Chloroflexi bacterium 44-23]|nr:MAG: VapC toxin family PIN domain ribonuclease [Chloroflexi bacterium 44-23]
MLIVDTSVWIDYFNGQINPETDYLEQALAQEFILMGDLILTETLQGFREEQDFQTALQAFSTFAQVNMLDTQLAIQSARNYRTLRKSGHTVRKTIDCLIATFCIENGHSLLHRDRDFDSFEKYLGLQVIHA